MSVSVDMTKDYCWLYNLYCLANVLPGEPHNMSIYTYRNNDRIEFVVSADDKSEHLRCYANESWRVDKNFVEEEHVKNNITFEALRRHNILVFPLLSQQIYHTYDIQKINPYPHFFNKFQFMDDSDGFQYLFHSLRDAHTQMKRAISMTTDVLERSQE